MTSVTHPRTLLVEFLGAFVRHQDNWTPVAALVSLMGEVGLDESTVRTLVSRLKQREWLVPERRNNANGYRLSDIALRSLDEGDQIVWHARQHVNLADGWALVAFSVPEKERSKRHLIRSRLGALGFGNVGAGIWLAPARMLPEARSLLEELNLTKFVDLFVAQYAPGQELSELIQRGWDLESLNHDYKEFVAGQEPVLKEWRATPGTDADAFRAYMLALNQWRKLPFRDPGLPTELLGTGWAGDAAGVVFEEIVEELEPSATRHVQAQWANRAT
jgi:phenylacetic acid degradation operon negative regulatory protein